jgi:glycosyltransferase involved in cell wall biosynthesis
VPPVSPDEVVPFIRSADAALVLYYARSPNYEHCLPNGFFQSVGANLPVLYPELPELRRLATEYGFGLPIDPRDPNSIRDAVCALLRDRTLRESLRQRSASAAQALSWEREERALCELVERALAGAEPVSRGAGRR